MIWLAVAPISVGVLLALYADPLARRMRPSTATRVLTALALTVALCTGLVLSAVAMLVLVQLGPMPRLGGWSTQTLRTDMGFPVAIGVGALIVVTVLLGAAVQRAAQSVRLLARAHRSATRLDPTLGDLVVIDDAVPTAYSIAGRPGRPGRIVVSTSMLAALSAGERRALIAHEESHLRHRHHIYAHLADLATAANPLLRPTSGAIKRAVERWADEDAGAAVGDRALAGRALARAALATAGRPTLHYGLAIADGCVADRVEQLFAPVPRRRWWPIALVAVAGLSSWIAAAAVADWANDLVQLAESVYQRH